ncbi:MAG: hypothetical protein R3217_08570 [Gammaproteobacteria bacterium]|nr:hypothetical protein [Gammaproteobacteria bacterium]
MARDPKRWIGQLILVVGIVLMGIAAVSIYNSELDSREVLVITILSAGFVLVVLGVTRLTRKL